MVGCIFESSAGQAIECREVSATSKDMGQAFFAGRLDLRLLGLGLEEED
ncbi:hypothetical protein ACPOL_0862 [Acidisarcina polymorpha]|uniref:Uncharacterized protein n=1 Tax=Acidisarcina polymorpha TaxID=2211140 RepID=A0A2Z5FTQ0_9BACT|nr:hypothetical protein ACPOL_0862 [Acidisarcina polymorpha]